MPGTDRRNSSSSEDASLPPTKQILQDGTEFIPTRTAKSGAPKPAANPLQFIKVGPCDLYKAAQEQLKKVEEIKKVEKTVKTEAEDWQSNLDNWKCSRRKRQEHIIDRVVEVKKFELEEQERNRRRGKTLNEMMEERAQKGIGPRKMSLMTYPDDDTDDFTDLGLSLSNKGNDSSEADSHNETEQNDNLEESENKVENGKKNGSNGHDPSSSEAEEYTYERAIQGYKSYAEKSAKAASRPRVSPPKPGGRIGEKLNELEQVRLRSNSVSDVQLPKVDIHKRRSLFEVVESAETKSPSAERVARDLGGAQIVKERLSSLERRSDSPKSSPRPTEEISITLKDRLSNLEKQKSQEPVNRLPSDEIAHVSIKERLTSLEKGIKENISSNSCSDEEMKELLSPAASEREISSPLGAETSESGIDMEESSLYTDENIDEVLGADDDEDVDEYPESREGDTIMEPHDEDLEELNHPRPISLERHRDDSGFSENRAEDEMKIEAERKEKESELRRQQEAVTRFDELIGFGKEEPANIVKAEVPVESVEISMKKPVEEVAIVDNFVVDEVRKPVEEILTPVTLPMKQKETPIALYENISIVNQMMELASPSDVIGFPLSPTSGVEPPKEKPPPPPIDLSDDEPAPELPPKSTSLRRLDSTKRIKKEIRKKRSDFLGIEGANDDAYLEPEVDVEPPPDMITLLQEERRLEQQLYRQSLSSDADSTENASTVDRLEKTLFSDQGLYRQSICSESDSNHETAESRDSGVELDRGHVDELCWNKPSSEPHSRQNSEPFGNPSVTSEEDEISKKEREIIAALEKEEEWRYGKPLTTANDAAIGDVLAVKLRQLEEEKLQLEWERAEEEGRRMADEERIQAKETLLRQQETSPNTKQSASKSQDNLRAERERLEKEQLELERARQELMRQRSSEPPVRQAPMGSNLRYSMPDLQETRPPPPNPRPPATWSRAPSADNLLAPQQMTRTTLHALSAAPRSRIVNGETWMQPKRKSDAPKSSYNYQHWLIQEAEHRRITEQQQRATQARRSLPVQASRSPAHYNQPAPPQQRPISAHYPVGHTHAANGPLIASPPIPNGVNYGSSPIGSHVRALSNPGHPPSVQHSHNLSAPNPHTVGLPPSPHPHNGKPLPDSIIQTLTQRVQNKAQSPRRRVEERPFPTKVASPESPHLNGEQERMLSVSGKKKCSHCGDELGRGAAMVIESLRLFYHIDCFKCCVCHTQLGDGLMGTDVRVRNNKLHCHNCYSSDDGVKFSCV